MTSGTHRNGTFTPEIEHLAWDEAGAPGISQKILRQDSETGAQTLLLRSAARSRKDIVDRRPQHHPVDEEFLCLAGRFTLEGTHWLTPMTYVYYPAGLVHGFGVDVPGGYEIYLRNPGPVTTERVDTPAQSTPYIIGTRSQDSGSVIVSDCSPLIDHAVQSSQLSVITLRTNHDTKEGALIACLPANGRMDARVDGPGAYAEILVLAGEIQLGDPRRMGKLSHAYLDGPTELQIIGIEPAILMLNYRDANLATEITRQVESSYAAGNSY